MSIIKNSDVRMDKKSLVENSQKQQKHAKNVPCGKKICIHTARLIYQEERNAAEEEFGQHNKKSVVSNLGGRSD